jgi:hypothetical protein
MPGLVPGIHVFGEPRRKEDVDGRDKPGRDDRKNFVNAMFTTFMRVRFTNVFE